MPFDGICTHAMVKELSGLLTGTHIDKIYQPEADEMVFNIRSQGQVLHLVLSASASHARIQLSKNKPETPMNPPAFCMLLRKNLSGGKLVSIRQHHYDRIVQLTFEGISEMGDTVERSLYLEMMGKHSNLILVGENGKVVDSIRRVNPMMSSVRLVEPGLVYQLPTHNHKADPHQLMPDGTLSFDVLMRQYEGPLDSALYQVFNGLSPFASHEVLTRAGIDGRKAYRDLEPEEAVCLQETLKSFIRETDSSDGPYFLYRDKSGAIVDFSTVPYVSMSEVDSESFDTLSSLLDVYYQRRDTVDKMKQKSQELRRLVNTDLERARRKLALQEKQIAGTKDRDKYRLRGDLITANMWQLKLGQTKVKLPNYYEEGQPLVDVTLDVNLTPAQNAQKQYARYNKLKRTEEALTGQIKTSSEQVSYLESIMEAISMADCEQDIEDIKQELHETGYLKKAAGRKGKKNLARSKPLEFITSEGVKGLIGKNNIQNDQLTFQMARPQDIWLHVKDIHGSHVILRTSQLQYGSDYTERTLLEGAAQAAAHSKAVSQGRVTAASVAVDYTARIFVKKPAGSAPGFVRYTHQTTLMVPAEQIEKALTDRNKEQTLTN